MRSLTSHPSIFLCLHQQTLDEVGIQLFAREKFDEALNVFTEAQKIRASQLGAHHPAISMVLNNIACCRFSQGDHKQAFMTLTEAREIHTKSAQDDLDLLHVAMTLGNLGYLLIQLRRYEEAQEMFEEALLVRNIRLRYSLQSRMLCFLYVFLTQLLRFNNLCSTMAIGRFKILRATCNLRMRFIHSQGGCRIRNSECSIVSYLISLQKRANILAFHRF